MTFAIRLTPHVIRGTIGSIPFEMRQKIWSGESMYWFPNRIGTHATLRRKVDNDTATIIEIRAAGEILLPLQAI